jgi:hypothetical protein
MTNFQKTFAIKWKNVNIDNPNTEYDIQKLNKEFKNLHIEVMDIVNKTKGDKVHTTRSKNLFQIKKDNELNSLTKSQKENVFPKIIVKESINKSTKEPAIKAFLSQRLKAEELEDQRIKDDIEKVRII